MSLILAIESDHRQAGHLVQIVRRQLNAELILAETFEAALPAIGNRVPDLILVPALLSPEDDAALKFVLRSVSHGSHIQVLSTPMFGGSHAESSSRRILTGLFRTRTKSAVDGCDPREFARHIASYLRAADEKRPAAQPPLIAPAALEYEAASTLTTPPPEPVLAPMEFEDEVSAPVAFVEPEPEPEPIFVVDAEQPESPAVVVVDVEQPERPAVVVDDAALDRLVADLNRLLTTAPAAPPPVAVPVKAVDASAKGDEWGLFDPKRCGMEALLVKLKETS